MVKRNSGTIRNRLKILIAQKEVRDERKYTYMDIQEATGVATSTLTDWSNGKARLISVDTLAALCTFLECVPGDLLEYIPPEPAAAVQKPRKAKERRG